MRITSDRFSEAVHAQESGEVLLPLVALSHATWSEPVRLVRDLNPLIHLGETYDPAAFQISLPDDIEEGAPVMQWSIDNTDRRLIGMLRAVSDKVHVDVRYVLASTPDVIEAGPFEMELTQADYDASTISGGLTIDPILDEQAGYLMMTPATAPGLF